MNNVQIEGVDNNHRSGLLTTLIPPIEAIAAVDITTSNYEAELGRASGAVVNVTLRSGTNELPGSTFEFNRVGQMGRRLERDQLQATDFLEMTEVSGCDGGSSFQGTRPNQQIVEKEWSRQ